MKNNNNNNGRKSFSIIINFLLNYAQGNNMVASNGSCNSYNAYTKQHTKNSKHLNNG